MNLTGGMKEVHGNLSFLNTIDYIIHLVAAGKHNKSLHRQQCN